MTPERQTVLSEFVATQMMRTPKTLRVLSVVMLVLCGGGLALLAAVYLDGAATLDDVGLPLVLFGVFTALALVGVIVPTRQIRGMPQHPLIVALREHPDDIVGLTPTTIVGRGGHTPALNFALRSGKRHLVIMGEATRAEIMAWLSQRGTRVG